MDSKNNENCANTIKQILFQIIAMIKTKLRKESDIATMDTLSMLLRTIPSEELLIRMAEDIYEFKENIQGKNLDYFMQHDFSKNVKKRAFIRSSDASN